MIRIAIVADTLSRARGLAELLGEDGQFEIVSAGILASSPGGDDRQVADVVVATGLSPDRLPRGGSPVIFIGDQPVREELFSRSIRAWLSPNVSPTDLSAAIYAVAHDFSVLTQEQARKWIRGSARTEEGGHAEALTAREAQVLRMLSDGLGNKEIAAQLGISEHTAKFHVAQILAKLGAGSRAEAVALGIRRGLVPI